MLMQKDSMMIYLNKIVQHFGFERVEIILLMEFGFGGLEWKFDGFEVKWKVKV